MRSSSRPEFIENTAGMGLHRALTHKKLPGDFAVAQALGDQFKDLKLAASDMEVLTFFFVGDERSLGMDGDLPHNNCLAFCCQLEAKPDAKNGKGRGDQSAVDFDGMLDDQELILGPLEQGNQDSTDQPVHEDMALHKLQEGFVTEIIATMVVEILLLAESRGQAGRSPFAETLENVPSVPGFLD